MFGNMLVWALLSPLFLPIFLISLLPYRVLHATVGRCCYFLLFRVTRYRYSVVLQNLSRALPEKSYGEIHRLAISYYRYLAGLLVEMVKLISVPKSELLKRVKLVNPDLLDYYYGAGRNIIAVLGHYGNWEVLNTLPAQLPYRIHAIYKPLSNPTLCRLMRAIRSRFGLHLIPAGSALRYLLTNRYRGPSMTLFIADQFPGGEAKCRVTFMNQQTGAFNGAEKLAKATDSVVIYVTIEPRPDSSYDVHFSLITDHPRETAIGEITTQFNEKLQHTIEQEPVFWLWSHRRWK